MEKISTIEVIGSLELKFSHPGLRYSLQGTAEEAKYFHLD